MKCGVSIALGQLLWTLLLGVALAGPASGDPIEVFFDGPVVGGEHRGLAAPPIGVPVLDLDVYSVIGSLSVEYQSADGLNVGPGPAPNIVTSDWVVENQFGDFPGEVYLLFAQELNRDFENIVGTVFPTTYATDFTDPNGDGNRAGMMIDPDAGWRIIQTEDFIDEELTDFFYVGIPLGDFMNIGQDCGGQILIAEQTCVAVTYFLQNPDPNVFDNGPNKVLALPQLNILMAVVPEPGTGSLLALGLAALAASRRRQR